MKTLLWLDDIRDPFVYDWLISYAPDFANGEGKVVWVKTFNGFVSHIKFKGIPDMISFDHDLGEIKSGYDCAKWLVDYCLDNKIPVPKFGVHSANPVGAENIRMLLNNYSKFLDEQKII